MKNSLPLRCLVEALQNVSAAQQREQKARDEYEGPSWGYVGHHYIEATERAVEEFDKYFDAYIEDKLTKLGVKISKET